MDASICCALSKWLRVRSVISIRVATIRLTWSRRLVGPAMRESVTLLEPKLPSRADVSMDDRVSGVNVVACEHGSRLKETERAGGRPVSVRLRLFDACLEFGVGVEDEVADAVLRRDIV